MAASLHILGVRHHGPGSARAVLRALETLRPASVAIEGPADADDVLALAGHAEMQPPVAILVYAADDPKRAIFAPFAEFSPEWCALRWALQHDVPARFMDLPQSHRFAIAAAREQAGQDDRAQNDPAGRVDPSAEGTEEPPSHDARQIRLDPLCALAHAAGFDDGERWWEHVIEHRRHDSADVFQAIGEAMLALREDASPPAAPEHLDAEEELLREAWMRRTLRQASKDSGSIAVVCGAWHAAVLDTESLGRFKKDDEARLKGLPKVKTVATWVPWTYEHLAASSGYGAGVRSPGWYEHLWRSQGAIVERWMTRVARLLREEGLDCSSAHAIEASRLAGALAALRGRPLADLSDIADACRSIFCFDSDLGMTIIGRKLLLGERLGAVPADIPLAPLQKNLQATQKRLRLKPQALEKILDLDLRNETDLARSHLLHRLRLLDIEWGSPERSAMGKGTFRELWRLRWDPVYLVRLIEYGRWGSTVEAAASTFVRRKALDAPNLASLAELLDDVLLADLPQAVESLMDRILSIASVGADVAVLMSAFPPLARVLRYGNVRNTDVEQVRRAIRGILPRICVGLPPAAASLNDEAARAMEAQAIAVHDGVMLLESPSDAGQWLDCLQRIADAGPVHGLLRGRCARLLFDAGRWNVNQAATRLSLTLSRGTDATQGAAWIEGFLRSSGLLLVHHENLLSILDEWLCSIASDAFLGQMPLLRRTFSTFAPAERRQIAERLRTDGPARAAPAALPMNIDCDRAARVLPILRTILLGVPANQAASETQRNEPTGEPA